MSELVQSVDHSRQTHSLCHRLRPALPHSGFCFWWTFHSISISTMLGLPLQLRQTSSSVFSCFLQGLWPWYIVPLFYSVFFISCVWVFSPDCAPYSCLVLAEAKNGVWSLRELQMVVNYHVCADIEPSALNGQTISLALIVMLFTFFVTSTIIQNKYYVGDIICQIVMPPDV